jgi:hypothetical protein
MSRVLKAALLLAVGFSVAALFAAGARAQGGARYSVTITNLTKGQSFTPFLLATHAVNIRLFAPGTAASDQLRVLAEEGDTAPLAALLRQTPIDVREIVTGSTLLTPAVTTMFEITADGNSDRLSLAAMLIPTNDAFVGISSIQLPSSFEALVIDALAYDSGTERNDERCASIPGPAFSECSGPGGGARVGNGEGAVTVHNGIHGVGDMNRALRDWRNPVARVTIRRLR